MQSKKPWNKEFFAVSCLIGVFVAATWGYYFWTFAGQGTGDQGTFGTFGDFVGGVLNPILSAVTVLYLVRSFAIQSEALAKSERFHTEQQEQAKAEQERHQLEEFVRKYIDQISSMLKAPMYRFSHLGESIHCSLEQLFFDHRLPRTPDMVMRMNVLQEGLPFRNLPSQEAVHMVSLHQKYEIMQTVARKLIPYLAVPELRAAWLGEIADLVHKGGQMGIIDKDSHIEWFIAMKPDMPKETNLTLQSGS